MEMTAVVVFVRAKPAGKDPKVGDISGALVVPMVLILGGGASHIRTLNERDVMAQ